MSQFLKISHLSNSIVQNINKMSMQKISQFIQHSSKITNQMRTDHMYYKIIWHKHISNETNEIKHGYNINSLCQYTIFSPHHQIKMKMNFTCFSCAIHEHQCPIYRPSLYAQNSAKKHVKRYQVQKHQWSKTTRILYHATAWYNPYRDIKSR